VRKRSTGFLLMAEHSALDNAQKVFVALFHAGAHD
jgi:hypothetical protein